MLFIFIVCKRTQKVCYSNTSSNVYTLQCLTSGTPAKPVDELMAKWNTTHNRRSYFFILFDSNCEKMATFTWVCTRVTHWLTAHSSHHTVLLRLTLSHSCVHSQPPLLPNLSRWAFLLRYPKAWGVPLLLFVASVIRSLCSDIASTSLFPLMTKRCWTSRVKATSCCFSFDRFSSLRFLNGPKTREKRGRELPFSLRERSQQETPTWKNTTHTM